MMKHQKINVTQNFQISNNMFISDIYPAQHELGELGTVITQSTIPLSRSKSVSTMSGDEGSGRMDKPSYVLLILGNQDKSSEDYRLPLTGNLTCSHAGLILD
jgi:hypothetical protein